jgi:hypothetical protein
MAMIKNLMGDSVKTEQGVRTLIRQYEAGKKDEEQLDFKPVRVSKDVVFIKITNPKIDAFRTKLLKFASENAPK